MHLCAFSYRRRAGAWSRIDPYQKHSSLESLFYGCVWRLGPLLFCCFNRAHGISWTTANILNVKIKGNRSPLGEVVCKKRREQDPERGRIRKHDSSTGRMFCGNMGIFFGWTYQEPPSANTCKTSRHNPHPACPPPCHATCHWCFLESGLKRWRKIIKRHFSFGGWRHNIRSVFPMLIS